MQTALSTYDWLAKSTCAFCRCVYQHPDSTGKIGVELSRDLVKVAGKALTNNLTKLGPKVLPWSEKLLYAANWVARKVAPGKWQEYVPDFKEAFDHFCLHAGKFQLLFARLRGALAVILHAATPVKLS